MLFDTTPTAAQIADYYRQRFMSLSMQAYQSLRVKHRELFDLVWNNSDQSAQAFCDSVGANALAIFSLSNDYLAFIAAMEAKLSIPEANRYVCAVPNVVTFDAQGNATIGDPIAPAAAA